MSKCIQCGGELTTGDTPFICMTCKMKNEQQTPPMQGWICPRCGTVHSPFITECSCPLPTKIWWDSTTRELKEDGKL
jgi:hypothetical protein